MTTAREYARQHRENHLAELQEFLRIPSNSTDPQYKADMQAAARWLSARMQEAGLEHVRLFEDDNGAPPLIYGTWLHAGAEAPTVLVYGHYDIQPPDPLDLWETPPFEPVVRDDYLYARGASDDKGQVYIHVKAVQSLLETTGRLPVNIKFLIEGEEEIGGGFLARFLPENKTLLAADVALVSDTAILSPEQPAIIYGLRGMLYVYVDVQGPGRDLHSGMFGGGVNNPINALAQIIARLQDPDGKILVPGFYDQVRELAPEEREMLSRQPLDEEAWLEECGAPETWGEPEYTLVERLSARPTLDVNGIVGGYTGAGRKTVLPAKAHAKISMRLVPDQDPAVLAERFTAYVEEIAPPGVEVKVTVAGMGRPSITDYEIPPMRAAAAAYAEVFGREPLFTREGGSIPVVGQFQRHLGLETVLMGFGLPGDKIHSPNENFYLPNFYRGIETVITFLEEYGRRSEGS